MAFILEDRDQSITSESAPLIQPLDYDSDIELFQVPLKRGSLPLAIPGENPLGKSAIRYALATSPPTISEETVSSASRRNSSPEKSSGEEGRQRGLPPSPPSSVYSTDEQGQPQQPQLTVKEKNQVIFRATGVDMRITKARTVLTKRPRRVLLSLQLNASQTPQNEEDWSHIYRWLDGCYQETSASQPGAETSGMSGNQLLHPFLGPLLFSPIIPTAANPAKYRGSNNNGVDKSPDQEPALQEDGTRLSRNPELPAQPTSLTGPYEFNNMNPFQLYVDPQSPNQLYGGGAKALSSSRQSAQYASHDSAYDRARELEIQLSQREVAQHNHHPFSHHKAPPQLKGKDHWVIDCDLTEASHFRLAEVARRSAQGFDLPVRVAVVPGVMGLVSGGGDGVGSTSGGDGLSREEQARIQTQLVRESWVELANLYRVLAVVHTLYGEEMRQEREALEMGRADGGKGMSTLERRQSGRAKVKAGRRNLGRGSVDASN